MFAKSHDAKVDLAALGKQMASRRAELKAEFKATGLPIATARTASAVKIELDD